MQPVWLPAFWYWPAAQMSQIVWPARAWYCPAAQLAHAVVPRAENFPVAQGSAVLETETFSGD